MRGFVLSVLMMWCVLTAVAMPAHAQTAPDWKALPAACLPHRAQVWQNGVAEPNQSACHCPPSSMCPVGIVEYLAVANAYQTGIDANGVVVNAGAIASTRLPPNIFRRCCPAPVCPAGSRLEGQLPTDGNCNPTCPAGTQLAGQVYPADWNCNPFCPAGTQLAGQPYPADWNCNPRAVCPVGTLLAGQFVPADGECSPGPRCPAGTNLAGQLVPGGDSRNCGCPAGSTLAGQTIPEDWNCNPVVVELCPAGTTFAGMPVANVGGAAGCNQVTPGDGGGAGDSGGGGADGGGDCLSGDAQLIRADGSRVSIATIAAGEEVEGIDGTVKVKTLTRIEQSRAPLFYRINDLPFLITGEHPIETKDGWKVVDPEVKPDGKYTAKLHVGDVLVGKDTNLEVKSITLVPHDAAKGAYNLATEGDKPVSVGGVSVKPFNGIELTY